MRYKYIGTGPDKVREHILVAERVLGHKLPPGAQVHHVDRDGLNNRPDNLVICDSAAYHNLLHRRMRARPELFPEPIRAVAGISNTRKTHCPRGHPYDLFYFKRGTTEPCRWCQACRTEANRKHYLKRLALRNNPE